MRNIKLLIAYDGTHFSGWQRQSNAVTIQGVLEKELSVITNETISLNGAGRTDAGVHALGMVASFHTGSTVPSTKLHMALNSRLCGAIRILAVQDVAADFHARFSAQRKTYTYTIDHSPIQLPPSRLYATHITATLHLTPMRECLYFIQDSHDFASFEASGSRDKSITTGRGSVRTLLQAELTEPSGNTLQFTFTGDGFLRHMVRNLVGTLIDVGKGKTTVEEFKKIVAAKERAAAGVTAPPQGLFLKSVHY